MSDRTQLVALAASLTLLVVVLELVRRRKVIEEYAFVWIALGLLSLGMAARPGALAVAASWLGVDQRFSIGLLLLLALVVAATLSFTVIVSRQRRQIERLIEDVAVLSAEVRQLRTGGRGEREPPAASGLPNRPRT